MRGGTVEAGLAGEKPLVGVSIFKSTTDYHVTPSTSSNPSGEDVGYFPNPHNLHPRPRLQRQRQPALMAAPVAQEGTADSLRQPRLLRTKTDYLTS